MQYLKKHFQFSEHVHEWIENTSVIRIQIEANFLYWFRKIFYVLEKKEQSNKERCGISYINVPVPPKKKNSNNNKNSWQTKDCLIDSNGDNTKPLITYVLKHKLFMFPRKKSWFKYQRLSEDLLKSCRYTSAYLYQSSQNKVF